MNQSSYILAGVVVIILVLGALYIYSDRSPLEEKSPTNAQMLEDETNSQVLGSDVAYGDGNIGYFVKPQIEGTYPGVVMIHEWWGLNDNIRSMAGQLAQEGYMVLAVDLFGKVATTPEEARSLTNSFDMQKALQNLRAATAYLRNEGAVKVASLGWCFGGGQSLQLALSGEPLQATVIYYGQLVSDQQKLSTIQWPVLGIFGDKDTSIPVDTVKQFDAALDSAQIPNEVYIYPGVGHAFANPSGASYAPQETADAWAKTLAFLHKSLKETTL